MSKLLFEIGTEEIPAGFIAQALEQLEENFQKMTSALKISHGVISTLATPRRLTLEVDALAVRQEDIHEEIIGPSKKAGMDENGQFTKAAEGFARSKGGTTDALKVVDTPKGEYLMLYREVIGKEVKQLLPELLSDLLNSLSFPKSMRWGSNTIAFARPIQWLLAMVDDTIVTLEHEGIISSNTTRGHRFHYNEDYVIENVDMYRSRLSELGVLVDPKIRKEEVVATISAAVENSNELRSGKVFIDEDLLDTVTNLVEKPYGVCGSFDEKFLQLPDEVLITSMREHQKYFPIVDSDGKLLPGFVAVNNTRTSSEALTRQGHQRVLRARLEDALFFFNSDKKRGLEALTPQLDGIIFQAKLGTMREKKDRIVKLARLLAEMIDPSVVDEACRGGELCKADLLTDMVGEFPSLQGTMGYAYARHEGESETVANAIREHYMPKRAGATLPSELTGAIVGLADRFDTLTGCFGIDQIPTGTADPFGLRRISLAILHVMKDFNLTFSLREIMHKSLALYGEKVDGSSTTVNNVMRFVEGRFKNDCVAKGFDSNVVAASLAVDFDNPNDCLLRVDALSQMREDEDFSVLASSYKRIRNIIKENKETGIEQNLLIEDAEIQLNKLLEKVRSEIGPLLETQDYLGSLKVLLQMKTPVDQFFDSVMVMAEDPKVRQNRLNLLTGLGEMVHRIGDISLMHEG